MMGSDVVSYVKEIQLMMHGFGDVAEPLVASAQLIETVLLRQMASLWRAALDVAQLQDSLKPTLENFLFLLRKDSVRLKRFVGYLEKKRSGAVLKMSLGESTFPKKVASERLNRCLDYLRLIDPALDPFEEEPDDAYLRRKIRADLIARNLDEAKYLEFSKARQASFGHGKFFASHNAKFREWLARVECTSAMSNETCDAMAYFAYETVAQIVDLAFLVRQDSRTADPWLSAPTLLNLSLSRSPVDKLPDHRAPITPAEIREALRRYESSQIVVGCLFARQTSLDRRNLLCC